MKKRLINKEDLHDSFKTRLINKEDLQDHFKADLIDEILYNDLINQETNELYDYDDLRLLSYDDIVSILVDSKKIYIVEL